MAKVTLSSPMRLSEYIQRKKGQVLKQIQQLYDGADLNNPNYDDTINIGDHLEMGFAGDEGQYDVHDEFLLNHGVDPTKIKNTMPLHEIKAMFTK